MKKTLILLLAIGAIDSQAQKVIGSKTFGTIATVVPNENYISHSYKKILVKTGFTNDRIEKKVIKEFWDIGVPAIGLLEIMPNKSYSQEEIDSIYKKHEIDGIINIVQDEISSSSMQAVFELTLEDLQKKMIAVTYKGKASLSAYSALLDKDKSTVKFVRLVMDDIKPYLGK